MIVYLDTNCVIYLVEANVAWGPKVIARVAALIREGDEIAVSDLTRTECLAGPLGRGDAATLVDYQSFFASSAVKILSLTVGVCERAAQIRAASNFRLKVPDCLHLAAAIEHGCGLFLTNDVQLEMCSDIAVEILS
jgi:predicted nucleic acid-binding protein